MCSNYRPVTRMDRLLTFFGVEYAKTELEQRDVYPLGTAPFIRLAVEGQEGGRPALIADDAMFGLLPHWATEMQFGRKSYNVRSETVATKPAFREAWKRSQRCIIPAEAIYEPCYESGKAVRWRIFQDGNVPLGIAGIYTTWRAPDGKHLHTMSMLTVNADGHPLMSHMHGVDDEKRMIVILDQEEYLPWLTCSVIEAPRYFRQWKGALMGEPDAVQRTAMTKAPIVPQVLRPASPPPPVQDDLF